VFLILLAAASVWLGSGVFVLMTITLGAWYRGRRERLESRRARSKRRQREAAHTAGRKRKPVMLRGEESARTGRIVGSQTTLR
jgi:hypothetical protein